MKGKKAPERTNEGQREKLCADCNTWLPATAEYFNWKNKKKQKLQCRCKACTKIVRRVSYEKHRDAILERAKGYYNANREKIASYQREYAEKNNEAIKKRRRRYYERNRDARLEYMRRYYDERREFILDYQQQYRKDNREYILKMARVYKGKRKSTVRSSSGHFSPRDIRRQYKAQRGCCYWCGEPVGDEYHVDHVIPLARGGSNGPENIVIACPACNLSKGAKLPHEWHGTDKLL